MLRSTLAHLFGRKPFRPFLIQLATSETFEVTHPEAVYLGNDVFAVLKRDTTSQGDDSVMVWIGYDHIVYCQPIKRENPF